MTLHPLTVVPDQQALSGVPHWARPAPHNEGLRDGLSAAQHLLMVAVTEARPCGEPDMDECVEREVVKYGSAAAPGSDWTTAVAVGAPLLAGQLAAETLRREIQAHPVAGRDHTLAKLFNAVVGQLWAPGRAHHFADGHDPRDGLALMRHLRTLQCDRDLNPALECLARTAASTEQHYQGNLRQLAQAVVRHHPYTADSQGTHSHLAHALLTLVRAPHRDQPNPGPDIPERSDEFVDGTQSAAVRSGDAPRTPTRMEEQYLWRLCQHLAAVEPHASRRNDPWLRRAVRWSRQAAASGDRLLAVARRELYDVALQASLPLPTDDELSASAAACENALAVTLAAFAVLHLNGEVTDWPHTHSAETGWSLATVLAVTVPNGESHTLHRLLDQDPEGYVRMLRYLARSPHWIDLRTIAAVSYTRAGTATALYSNPTGHWPYVLESGGSWNPVVTLAREYHASSPGPAMP